MANPKNQYDPDYAVPPGWVLEERLDVQGMSHAKSVFVDEVAGNGTDIEEEANRWAARTLVPPREWRRFVATLPRRKLAVQAFADQQGIAPGIVVGMLQHEGVIPWSHLNGLKVRLKWRTAG